MSLFGFGGDVAAWYGGPLRGVDRLSLAAWGAGSDTPLFGGERRSPVTVVVRWHTDVRGSLVGPDGWSVLLWRVSSRTFQALGELHDDFPLSRHDILVRGDLPHLAPCAEALLAARLTADVRLGHAVAAAVRELDRLPEVAHDRAS